MTYTCIKKAFPQFSKDCKECPEYDPCSKGGKWCFIEAREREHIMSDAAMKSTSGTAMPILAKHDYRNVKIAENTTVTIDLEELKKQMERSHFPQLFQLGG